MSELSLFLKSNKIVKENVKYKATKSLCDENGEPLEWEIKRLTTKEDADIRDKSMVRKIDKAGNVTYEMDYNKYLALMISKSVVFPNLDNAELQDSYGVKRPEHLIVEMIDNPGEYNDFAEFIQKYNGFDETIEAKVEKAKN